MVCEMRAVHLAIRRKSSTNRVVTVRALHRVEDAVVAIQAILRIAWIGFQKHMLEILALVASEWSWSYKAVSVYLYLKREVIPYFKSEISADLLQDGVDPVFPLLHE